MATTIEIKRAYDAAQSSDGYRVFVDRLWPRGMSKEDFLFDVWCKELAPSATLRKWFDHKVERWDDFQKSYQAELRTPEQKERMRDVISNAKQQTITLLYGAKDTKHNQAVVLAKEMRRLT